MVITAVIIPADPSTAPLLSVIEPTLERAQRLVGGWIEGLPSDTEPGGWFAYGNEEAKLQGLEVNLRAHNLLVELGGHDPDDVLRGTVFIVGCDEDGEWRSVPAAAIAQFRESGLELVEGLAP